MGFVLDDGTGTGKSAEVNSEHQLMVRAVTEASDFHINKENEKVWSIPFEGLNPVAIDDYILYIKNTGTKTIHITDIRLMADTAVTQVKIHAVTGTASGGSSITVVSRTIGSSQTPSATIESGTDITGLTNVGIIFFMQLDTVDKEFHLSTSSTIRIPQDKAIAISVEIATANITGVISIAEEE